MTFSAHHAATGETLAPAYTDATPAEIDAVAEGARQAAEAFAATAPAVRAGLLEAIALNLEARREAWIDRAHLETGLPPARLQGECARTVGQLRLFAALVREGSWADARIDPADTTRKPAPKPDLRRMLRALGPVAVFGASNFPFAFSVAGGDTASALAAGNPVVVKAHPAHPGTSDIAAEAIRTAVAAAGLPAGVFGLVHGAAPEVSHALVRHPAICAVGFTGSAQAGKALLATAAARPELIPVFAEMGSINPIFVLPGALAERGAAIAEGLVNSFTLGVGQFCTKPGLVIGVAGATWESFSAEVAKRAQAVAPGVMLHAGIKAGFVRASAALQNVEWLAEGAAKVARVSAAEFMVRPELAQEIFGPYTLLVTARDSAELMALAEHLEGQLTATVHGTEAELTAVPGLFTVLTRKAGRVLCNGFPTGVEVSPAMQHGGPFPATTDARFTSVGTAAILRFVRPVCYQAFPDALLPAELQNANPLGLMRLVNNTLTREAVR
ncbi:MAG: aldehyde dehydrogenase (NADP(+)) [Verrucomicrobia bacterium]|nr:aldehyde dehydrogenase (NADP(+)) [Verrucomicrobiota bacterium]